MVLLILAGITITYVLGDNSVFKQAQNAKLQTEIAKAREQIETTFTQAKIFKRTDNKYNQDDYLNKLMKKEIPNIKISDEIVIVDGYAFEIDRSEPKIGEYVGEEKNLVFPDLEVSVPRLSENNKTASFNIKAREKENGISKIEILQEGHVIEKYDYDNEKQEVTETYIAKQNGKYVIRVYAKYSISKIVEVIGIIPSVNFVPNGNEEYKKEHKVTIKVSDNTEKVKSIKYQWLPTTTEPTTDTFIEESSNNAVITGKGYIGTYYLWILLETESGKTNIGRSEGFSFDNEGPTVSLTTNTVSNTSFQLTATANDTKSGIAKYEFYVSDKLVDTQETTSNSTTYTWNGTEMLETKACVIVTDVAGNTTKTEKDVRTKLHFWEEYNLQNRIPGYIEKTSMKDKLYAKSDYLGGRMHHNGAIKDTYRHLYGNLYKGDILSISDDKTKIIVTESSPVFWNSGGISLEGYDPSGKLWNTLPASWVCLSQDAGMVITSIVQDSNPSYYLISGWQFNWVDEIPEGPIGNPLREMSSMDENFKPKNGKDNAKWYKYIGTK